LLKAPTAAKHDKAFSAHDHILMMGVETVSKTSEIYSELKRLITREDFVSNSHSADRETDGVLLLGLSNMNTYPASTTRFY
jgi:hypothetical protein